MKLKKSRFVSLNFAANLTLTLSFHFSRFHSVNEFFASSKSGSSRQHDNDIRPNICPLSCCMLRSGDWRVVSGSGEWKVESGDYGIRSGKCRVERRESGELSGESAE